MENGVTYLIRQDDLLKIGFTTDLNKRLKQYDTHNMYYRLLYIINGNCEKELHEKFKKYKEKTEWFKYNDEIVNYFKINGINFEFFNVSEKVAYRLMGIKPAFCIHIYLYLRLINIKKEFYIDLNIRKSIEEKCMLSQSSISKGIKSLVDNGILIKKSRGLYSII